jgi:putative peptidoglycan lipid II flippase
MTSAAVLLMVATLLSRVVGYLRDAYIAAAFGAGPQTDAFIAAFTLPDFLLYLFAGGSISITFISLLSRYEAEGRQQEAQEAFSAIVTILISTFVVFVALGEVFAPQFVVWWFSGFTPEQAELCTRLTRILLPQPIFLMVGGVVSAVQQTKRQFLIPAMAPIVYTLFIILGGVLFAHRFGIASLAIGATVGAVCGPFLLNALGARQAGIRYRLLFAPRHPAFREWLWMSLPLMIGVSVVAADDWILRNFASGSVGDITRLNYAKRLLQVPIGVLGQAVGVASLPFFARLWNENKREEFASLVNTSITRLAAICFLATSWMMAVSLPLIDIAFRRGRFQFTDSKTTAYYFYWFSITLVFWSVQGIYARAFYVARDMVRPMVAGTIITLLSISVYWELDRRYGSIGLVAASDLAIFTHTAVLAVMLHARGMVSLARLGWKELGKVLLCAVAAAWLAVLVGREYPYLGTHISAAENFCLVTVTWLGASLVGLWLTRSELLQVLQTKLGRGTLRAAIS